MGKKKKDDGGVDLFSFLNIMTATIGVQTLMLIVFALQIKPGAEAVRLLPTGSSDGSVTNFVITQGDGKLDLVRGRTRQTVQIKDGRLDKFLDEIAEAQKSKKQYIVIGVRPNAYLDFESIRNRTEDRKLNIGYEPLESELKVSFPQDLVKK